MKKVTLFVAAMFLTTIAFSQKLVKTETAQGTKYVEENVDLNNKENNQEFVVLSKGDKISQPKKYDASELKDKKGKIIVKKPKWKTPKEARPQNSFERSVYNTESLIGAIKQHQDKYFVKEMYEDGGTYHILFYPVK